MNAAEWIACATSMSIGVYGWMKGVDPFDVYIRIICIAILLCAFVLWIIYSAYQEKE